MGTLFVVATPIGNLDDITLRALALLREADLIVAEDTRRTRALLRHYAITTPILRYDEHTHARQTPRILQALAQGQQVALVSDAGTPTINDPGQALVQAAWEAGHRVSPIPGPSAVIAALSASGLPTTPFLYLGYPPRKAAERRRWLQAIAGVPATLVLLEAPHRLSATLHDLAEVLGADRALVVARELTKVHEEFWRGRLGQAVAAWQERAARGEFTLIVGPPDPRPPERWSAETLQQAIAQGLAAGCAPSALARHLAQQSGWSRREVYRRIVAATEDETS